MMSFENRSTYQKMRVPIYHISIVEDYYLPLAMIAFERAVTGVRQLKLRFTSRYLLQHAATITINVFLELV